jgi:hypothetical protein
MTSDLLLQLAYVAAVIVVPAAAVSLLAFYWAKRRAPRQFTYSVLLLTCVAGPSIVAAMRWLNPYSGNPLTWSDVPKAILAWSPVFLLSGALVWSCVKGSGAKRWIPLRATAGVIVAMPIGYIVGLLVD